MTYFTVKWKPEKAEKKLAAVKAGLLPNEDVWFLGPCNNFKPYANFIAITPLRLVALDGGKINFEARYQDISSLTTDWKKETITVVLNDGATTVFKMVPKEDHPAFEHYFTFGQGITPPPQLVGASAAVEEEAAEVAAQLAAVESSSWPQTAVRGKLTKKASLAVKRQCHGGEHPWLILTSFGGAGVLVAFDDRMAIIKTGAFTSYMAGSLGGERSATFNFPDVTGIEYNSGFVSGVLEILTPSYNGSANRDFWSGSTKSRNANANNPWTLSNCLPLDKAEYAEYLADINELKARISRSKQMNVQVMAPAPAAEGLADQLGKLAELKNAGVLSEDEFAAAKARLLTP